MESFIYLIVLLTFFFNSSNCNSILLILFSVSAFFCSLFLPFSSNISNFFAKIAVSSVIYSFFCSWFLSSAWIAFCYLISFSMTIWVSNFISSFCCRIDYYFFIFFLFVSTLFLSLFSDSVVLLIYLVKSSIYF